MVSTHWLIYFRVDVFSRSSPVRFFHMASFHLLLVELYCTVRDLFDVVLLSDVVSPYWFISPVGPLLISFGSLPFILAVCTPKWCDFPSFDLWSARLWTCHVPPPIPLAEDNFRLTYVHFYVAQPLFIVDCV